MDQMGSLSNVIAVMNTKGGVGKSTVVLALAETLSLFHDKSVLIIDSDAQGSVSYLLAGPHHMSQLQEQGRTLVDLLLAHVLRRQREDWRQYITGPVSDVDDARRVWLMASDTNLTLLEREISSAHAETRLRQSIHELLADVSRSFDVVLVDCPPGLSIVTECWLREADFHLSPTKPDYISACGLAFFRRFKQVESNKGFARNLGVLITMKDASSPVDAEFHKWLAGDAENRCFETVIPRSTSMQYAASFVAQTRSYAAKYPGDAGVAIRKLTAEVLARLAAPPVD